MSAKLLEGKVIASRIKDDIKTSVDDLKEIFGEVPTLANIQVGDNPGSAVYLKSQTRLAEKLGIEFQLHKLKPDIKEVEFMDYVFKLNKDENVNGILVQLPLPAHLDAKKIPIFIDAAKDVEAMHPRNLGKIVTGKAKIAPCTAMAAMELINSTRIDLYGKEAVVVGHSEIVGKPVSLMLLDKFATVTTCHIGTGERGNLPEHVKRAEVLVVAVGKAGLIKGEWIKEGAIVIDVGINRVGNKIVGDVEFEEAQKRASYITPVPGGVGPLTVTLLMRNVVQAFKDQK